MLKIDNVTISVNGNELLKNINLEIPHGETYVLFGENGSGKTSLLMAIMGLGNYKVTEGRIYFGDRDITDLPSNERAGLGIGMMFQRPPTIRGVSIRQIIEIISDGQQSPEEIAQRLNFTDLLDRDVNLGFSGGEIKRAELLQLLAQDPELVLLDEPESGVDLINVSLIGEVINVLLGKNVEHAIRRRKKSGLVITHTGFILDYVEADRGCVLTNETIWCMGNPRDILHQIQNVGYEECARCQI